MSFLLKRESWLTAPNALSPCILTRHSRYLLRFLGDAMILLSIAFFISFESNTSQGLCGINLPLPSPPTPCLLNFYLGAVEVINVSKSGATSVLSLITENKRGWCRRWKTFTGSQAALPSGTRTTTLDMEASFWVPRAPGGPPAGHFS